VTQPASGRESRRPVSEARRRGGRFALLALAALLAVRLPLPWSGAALLLAVVADVEGVRTALAISRERLRSSLLVWCVAGIVLISLLGLGVAATFAFYPVTYQRQQCLQGANTDVAKAACESEFNRRLGHLNTGLLGG
jgi:hypothetical protein